MKDSNPKIFLPGDRISIPNEEELKLKEESVIAGPGLQLLPDEYCLIVTRCGIFRHKEPHTYWIDTHSKRYIPVQNDRVIGVVTQKHAETWKLDIGSADLANLHYLAFENVTKRNKPMFKEGKNPLGGYRMQCAQDHRHKCS